MSNPFHDSMDQLRGHEVRAVSNAGVVYRGFVERVHHRNRHLVLRGATRLDDGEDVGAVLVSHADTVEVLDEERIECVPLEEIEPAPYHCREFQREDNLEYIAQVRDDGWAGSFPIVREIDDGFEVVAGHKRLWVADQAGLDTHPVEIADVDDWELAQRWAWDHLPDEDQLNEDGTSASGCYDDTEIGVALDVLLDEWGTRAVEIPRVAFNLDRLKDVSLEDFASDLEDDDVGETQEESPTLEEAEVDTEDLVDEPDESEDGDGREESPDASAAAEEPSDRDFGTYETKDYGLVLNRDVQEHFEGLGADRVTVRERDDRVELAPGESDDWPDYAVSSAGIQVGSPGQDVLGVGVGDKVRAEADGNVVVLELVNDGGSDQDTNRDGASEAEEDAEPPDAADADEHRIGDELADVEDQEASADGGAQAAAQTDTGASAACQNCGSHVTADYARVFTPDGEDDPRVCPNCEDKIREGDGTVREKRHQKKEAGN